MKASLAILGILGSAGIALAQASDPNPAATPSPEQPAAQAPDSTGTQSEVIPPAETPPPAQTPPASGAPAVVPLATEPQEGGAGDREAVTPSAPMTEVTAAPVSEAAAGASTAGSSSSDAKPGASTLLSRSSETGVSLEDRTTPWAISVVLEHAVGTGTFVRNSSVRERTEYVAQSWDIRPSYRLPLWGHDLSLSGRFLLEVEYTDPDTTPARHVKPLDSRVSLSDGSIYKEPVTGINFDGFTRFYLPTSYESINSKRQWSAFALGAGASRTLGDFDFLYRLTGAKYINSSAVAKQPSDSPRSSDGLGSAHTGDPVSIAAGAGNPSVLLTNTFEVGYSFLDLWRASYSLTVLNYFNYNVGEDDQYVGKYADTGRGRTDQLWPTLDLSFALSEALGEKFPWPVKLDLAAGITALHPAQTANNEAIIWPVFVQAFGSDRAADNYGSFYFDIVGTY